MNFAWPHLLWLLAAPATLLVWDFRHRQRLAAGDHPKILRAEAGHHQLLLNPGAPATRRHLRLWLALGLVFAVIALARPQWGRLEEPVFDQSREILIAVDLSRSMLTTDVKPSRLERAKLLIRSLLEKLEGERVGLVVFSGTAFLQSPLSADYEILREFLPLLDPDYLPEGGTNYQALLETTLNAFSSGTAADRFLIVLSDGEATDDDWKSLETDLKKKDIRAICLGVGTESGAMIPDGTGGFVKDERGAVVLSKLNSGTLRELARNTGGTYRDASTWLDLAAVLKETVEAGRKGEFVEKNNIRLVERFQWALAPALLFLLLSFWREFPVRPKPRDLKLTNTGNQIPDTGKQTPGTGKLAAVALLVFLSGIRFPQSAIAAAAAAAAPAPSPLGKIVGRLSAQDNRTGRDWAEFARETVTWGQKLQSEQHPVPEGPVRDALAAVDLGSAMDAKTADWPQLRSELEALLQKPEQQRPEDQKKDQQQQQNQDQQKDQQQDQQKQQDQQDSQQQKQDQSQSQPEQNPASKPEEQKDQQNDSAFGDMKEKNEPPPPPANETQKVGGTPEKKDGEKEPADPSLAMPLQKLDQIRNQDSPARLFQLMEGEKKPAPAKKGKNW
ncbi:MAG: VWA domain-containing protein [Opitutaceae bacterium]|nr:VWA domain-containing protein [Opitutaceae bacterium]